MNDDIDLLDLGDFEDEPEGNLEIDLSEDILSEDILRKEPPVLFGSEPEISADDVVPEEQTTPVELSPEIVTSDEVAILESGLDDDIIPLNRPRKVYGGMWGRSELAAVGAACVAILAMLLLVFFVVFPAQKELAANKKLQDQLDADLISAKSKYGSITDTETQVAKLISSVNDFETRFLPSESNGKRALYERLNGLIGAYALINSSGPEYAPLEILDPQRRQQPENERGRDKLMSLFPGVFVTVTVEGPYQNLRRFMREVETSQQFIMISSVELIPADKQKEQKKAEEIQKISETDPIPQDNNQRLEDIYRGKMHGEIVSLKIEMAAYFRRANYTPFTTEVSSR